MGAWREDLGKSAPPSQDPKIFKAGTDAGTLNRVRVYPPFMENRQSRGMIYYSLERTQEGSETVRQWAVGVSREFQEKMAKFAEEHPAVPVYVAAGVVSTAFLIETFPVWGLAIL